LKESSKNKPKISYLDAFAQKLLINSAIRPGIYKGDTIPVEKKKSSEIKLELGNYKKIASN